MKLSVCLFSLILIWNTSSFAQEADEQRIDMVNIKMDLVDTKLELLNTRIQMLDEKPAMLEMKFQELENNIAQLYFNPVDFNEKFHFLDWKLEMMIWMQKLSIQKF